MGSAMEMLQSGTKHTIAQANIDAKRLVQSSSNEKNAAEASLQNFAQSLANNKKLKDAGETYNAQSQTIALAQDKQTASNFNDRLRVATDIGAATAAASSAGVGGSSVDVYKATMRLRADVSDESSTRAQNTDLINATDQKSNIIADAVQSLSTNTFLPNMDYTQYIDHVAQKNLFGAAVAIGVASYFGGPQAGMAASDAIASGNRAANGDTAGANQLLNSAANNAAQAYNNYTRSAPAPQQPLVEKQSSSANLGTGLRAGAATSGSSGGFWGSTESWSIK